MVNFIADVEQSAPFLLHKTKHATLGNCCAYLQIRPVTCDPSIYNICYSLIGASYTQKESYKISFDFGLRIMFGAAYYQENENQSATTDELTVYKMSIDLFTRNDNAALLQKVPIINQL